MVNRFPYFFLGAAIGLVDRFGVVADGDGGDGARFGDQAGGSGGGSGFRSEDNSESMVQISNSIIQ